MKKQYLIIAISTILTLAGCKNDLATVVSGGSTSTLPDIPTNGVSMSQLLDNLTYYTHFTAEWGALNNSTADLNIGRIDVDFSDETDNARVRFDQRAANYDFTGYSSGSLIFDVTVASWGTKNDGISAHDSAYTPYIKLYITDENSPGFVEIHDIDPSNSDSVNWDDRVAVGTTNRCIVPLNMITSATQLTDSDGQGNAPWDFITFSGNYQNLNNMKYTIENIYFSPSQPSDIGGKADGVKCYR
jgi:hypothetical protein